MHIETPSRARALRQARARRLRVAGLAVLLLAAFGAAYGIYVRRQQESALAGETAQAAMPSVAVQHPATDAAPRSLSLPGDVQAWYEAPIYARVSGYLQNWMQDIGAHVRAGQVLGLIDTPELDQELNQAEADLATARANSALADLTAKRWRALLGTNSVSEQSVDEKQGNALAQHAAVNAAQARVDRLRALESFKRLVAPFAGIVTARNTDVGALINAGQAAHPLFRVADTHAMRIYVNVPQAYASELRPGLTATITQPQYPGVVFHATLATTAQSVNAESRTVLAELHAQNGDGRLWPGTYGEVVFSLPGDPHVLHVPSGALIFRDQGAELATVTPDDHVALRKVTIGRNLGATIEILSGVSAADRVIASPPDTLAEGDAVRVAAPEPAATPQAGPAAE